MKKNNTAADNVASLVIFYFILDYWLEDTALGGPNVDGSCTRYVLAKYVPAKLRSIVLAEKKKKKKKKSGSFFVLRFYHHDKTDIIERLIHASGLKMALKMSSVVKQLMYERNNVVSSIHSFRGSVVKKRFGSRIQSILLWT